MTNRTKTLYRLAGIFLDRNLKYMSRENPDNFIGYFCSKCFGMEESELEIAEALQPVQQPGMFSMDFLFRSEGGNINSKPEKHSVS